MERELIKKQVTEFLKGNIKDKMAAAKELSYEDPMEAELKIRLINTLNEDIELYVSLDRSQNTW